MGVEVSEKHFKILKEIGDESPPYSVPWEIIAPFQKRAKSNHGQSLEQLNARGGLSYKEMWLVLNDKPLKDFRLVNKETAKSYVINKTLELSE